VAVEEPVQKALEAFGLYIEIAGGTNKVGQLRVIEIVQLVGRQAIGGFQIGYRLFDIGPICVLREYRARNNLELRLARPPVLRAEMLEEDLIYLG